MATLNLNLSSLFNVKGKIVLVTGGGSGIGKMIAAGFSQHGAKVYIAARKEGQLKEAANDLNKSATHKVQYITADISSRAGCDALVAEFRKRENKLHVLVNNSGLVFFGAFDDFPEDEGWDNVFNVNVKSIFYLTSGLADLLSKDSTNVDPGRVINVSSASSVNPMSESPLSGEGTWSYQPSKAAVDHLTSTLALKLGPRQITVNSVLPGIFPSHITASLFEQGGGEEFLSMQPSGRFGMTHDMAGLAIFLASPASAHVTGAHILIDGGHRYRTPGLATSLTR